MREKDLLKLEYDKIREELKKLSHSKATVQLIEKLSPIKDREKLEEEISLYNAFVQVENITLYPFEDIRELLKKARIEGAILSAEDLLTLLKVLQLIREIRKVLGKSAESNPILRKLSRKLYSFSSLETLIEGSIDRKGFIKDSASGELYKIRKNIKRVEKEITDRLENLLRRSDADKVFSDKIITLRNGRYVVPVKSSQIKSVFGIVHGTSSSGFTTYVEPQFIVELNNKIAQLKEEEDREIKRILRRITSYVSDYAYRIEESFQTLVEIDLLMAKRELSKKYEGKFPRFGETVELLEARHPLLVLMGRKTEPVDIVLKEKRGLLLTGPNTGGKTVALKTLGLTALMVQSAIPVPVSSESTIRIFKNIFVDLGDEQSLQQNLSTFSSHITNIADFLEKVDAETLVLLDELGAGTDPIEGSALGIAILEYLKAKKVWVFANTHHTPIKIYAVNSDYFTPASVLFDKESLKPLYRIVYNSVGVSMAFEIARKCGLPEEIIKEAEKKREIEKEDYTKIAQKLTDYSYEYEKKIGELQKLKEDLQREKKKYEELHKEYTEFKRKAWKEVYKEAKDFLRKLMIEGQSVLKKAKTVQEIEKFVEEKEKQLTLFIPHEEIKEGDRVEFMGKKGKVLQIKNKRALLTVEGMRLWVDTKVLKKAKSETTPKVGLNHSSSAKSEIKLMGMDANTALIELEKFIEEAFSAGFSTVKVIHGIGTGVLRNVVHEFLSSCDKVRFYRPAYPKEGGSGVTIVFLRKEKGN